MKIYTQQEFDNLPVVDGRKQCPTGDYSQIKRFGESCSFGEWCSFENGYEANELPFVRINNIGSRTDGCYIYNFKKGIYVRSGCFFGTEQEFTQAVDTKHAGTKYQRQYQLALELAKATFE